MIDHANEAWTSRRASGLGRLAVLAAAWALATPLATPAFALDTSWQQACTFKNAPQNYGDAERERVCIVQNDCQKMADAQGRPYTGGGCIMFPPSASQPGPASAYTRR